MNHLLALLFSLVSTAALATDYPFTEVKCGDHWFEVAAKIDPATKTATVYFSGDSKPSRGPLTATVEVRGSDVIFHFQDGSGNALEIDGSDAAHNLFWGILTPSTSGGNLGLCSVN